MTSLRAALTLVLSLPVAAFAGPGEMKFVQALDRMMVEMARESARDSRAIKAQYRDHLQLLVLEEYRELEGALSNGGLAPVPTEPLRFNIAPRLTGPAPIAEKDLDNQISYIAARPATIGALLAVASRVKSGAVEVTSLVRHTEYQNALRATNGNAATSVPMHTMGLAFDIALVNTPLATVYEIRDVLRQMRDAGDLLFIGERRQLVFHVVPHPSRLGYFTEVYTRAVGTRAEGTHVVAFSTRRSRTAAKLSPAVTAEVIAVLPTPDVAEEWWGAEHAHSDLTVDVSPDPAAPRAVPVAAVTAAATLREMPRQFLVALFAAAVFGIAAGVRRMPAPDAGSVGL